MPVVRKLIVSPDLGTSTAPVSHAIQVDNTLYISGQLGLTKEMKLVDGIEAQTRKTLENIGHVLSAAGATYNNVVKTTVLLSDINNFDTVNKIYREFFTNVLPARVAYQVAVLPLRGLVEIEAVAIVDEIVEG